MHSDAKKVGIVEQERQQQRQIRRHQDKEGSLRPCIARGREQTSFLLTDAFRDNHVPGLYKEETGRGSP